MNAHDLAAAGCKLTMPSRPLTDPRFRYIDASRTDVRRTWRKARLLMRLQGAAA